MEEKELAVWVKGAKARWQYIVNFRHFTDQIQPAMKVTKLVRDALRAERVRAAGDRVMESVRRAKTQEDRRAAIARNTTLGITPPLGTIRGWVAPAPPPVDALFPSRPSVPETPPPAPSPSEPLPLRPELNDESTGSVGIRIGPALLPSVRANPASQFGRRLERMTTVGEWPARRDAPAEI
jgi:hypothetical protein